MSVGVIVIVYNLSSEMFLLQMAALKKFCKDEFTVEVFDNSDNLTLAEDIRYHAENMGLNYYKIFSSSKGSSDSHSWAANFAYQKLRDTYDLMLFLDHDCIPVTMFSPSEILSGGHVVAGIGQGALKKYMWPGCFFLNNAAIDKELVDFSTSAVYRLDTGGCLYKLIDQYGFDACIFFNEAYHQNPYFTSHKYSHYSAINNGMFYHLTNGSNWASSDRHEERINTFSNLVKEKTGL